MPDTHKKITAIRKKRRLSQLQAAERSNIPIRTYQRIESGESSASIDYLYRLADGFQCGLNDILHFDLETDEFPSDATAGLAHANQMLEAENGRLQQLVKWITEQLHGGGAKRNQNSLHVVFS
jgi:transcriptional regulator with XRE-family HTH domain